MQVDAYPHEGITELFKALSDPTRLRILALLLLHTGELCGCEVESTLGIARKEAAAKLCAMLDKTPQQVTELLWNTYDPWVVWLPFAAIGAAAGIGLFFYNRRAKHWADMNV